MPKPIEKTFGERIRNRRHKLGWSLRTLSSKCGLTIAFLSDLENGKRGVGLGNAVALAECLGVKLSVLVKP